MTGSTMRPNRYSGASVGTPKLGSKTPHLDMANRERFLNRDSAPQARHEQLPMSTMADLKQLIMTVLLRGNRNGEAH